MKCTLIFSGASFRRGGQNTPIMGVPEAYSEQKEACESHVAFCKHFGLDPTVIINTYRTRYTDELISWYSEHFRVTELIHEKPIGYEALIKAAMSLVTDVESEFILFVRIDILLKPKFLDVFSVRENLTFSSVCFTKDNFHVIPSSGLPRVADLILYVPKRFFHLKINLSHDSYQYYINEGLSHGDIDFFLDTFHDSDSEKDFNPLYKIVNRPVCLTWYDEGKSVSQVFIGLRDPST